MPLDLSSLGKSIKALSDLLAVSEDDQRKGQRTGIRAGVIQHFEVTYELCWKLIHA